MNEPNESWAVTVERNGENVVTLSSNGMGGRDLRDGDERTIQTAAEHLLSFIGAVHVPAAPQEPRPTELQLMEAINAYRAALNSREDWSLNVRVARDRIATAAMIWQDETRSPDGDGHEKGTVVDRETREPERPTAGPVNEGTELEGAQGKPATGEPRLSATSYVSSSVVEALGAVAGSEPAESHTLPVAEEGRALPPLDDIRNELLLWMDNSDPTAQFDAIGEKFYKETGFLRPGKSLPLEMSFGGSAQEERRETAWIKWCADWRKSMIDRLRAASPAPAVEETTGQPLRLSQEQLAGLVERFGSNVLDVIARVNQLLAAPALAAPAPQETTAKPEWCRVIAGHCDFPYCVTPGHRHWDSDCITFRERATSALAAPAETRQPPAEDRLDAIQKSDAFTAAERDVYDRMQPFDPDNAAETRRATTDRKELTDRLSEWLKSKFVRNAPRSRQLILDVLRFIDREPAPPDVWFKALYAIGIEAMTAQSDPYAEAATYRKSLIAICNMALKAQESGAAETPPRPDLLPEIIEALKDGRYRNREDFGDESVGWCAESAISTLIAEIERLRAASVPPETKKS